MFDRATCPDQHLRQSPSSILGALNRFQALLGRTLNPSAPSSNARDCGVPKTSRHKNQGEVHAGEANGSEGRPPSKAARAAHVRSICSRGSRSTPLPNLPRWTDLPQNAQAALIGLMTRLILDHAQSLGKCGGPR